MDAHLRTLERASRADPDDRRAARALAHRLDQAGDAPGAWRARCRLARAGDEEVWHALATTPAGALAPGAPVERTFEADVRVRADARTVLLAGQALQALDPTTLEPRWSVPGEQDLATLVGPYVVHAPAGEKGLVFRDAASGEEVARTLLATRARAAHATRDRLIVRCEHSLGTSALLIDTGDEPGMPLAMRPDLPPFGGTAAAARGLRVVREHAGIADMFEARDVDSDDVAWRTRHALLRASDRGIAVMTRDLPRQVIELDARGGAPRWSATLPWQQGGTSALFTDELVVVSVQVPPWAAEPRAFGVAAFERDGGGLRWTGDQEDQRRTFVAEAIAADVVYYVRSPDEGASTGDLRVVALDLRSGEPLWSQALGGRRGKGTTLDAVEGGVVAAWRDGERTVLTRLGLRAG